MEELLSRFNQLRLESLDDTWVEAVYYAEFLEYGEFPAEYNQVLKPQKIRTIFIKLMNAVDNWLNVNLDSDEEKSWAILSPLVSHRKVLALIGYFINKGSKNIANETLRTNALIAARTYIKLLSIPGFLAYAVYHSQLFANSLACVGYPKLLYDKYEEQKTKWSKEDRATRDDYIGNLQALTDQVNDILKSLIYFVTDLNNMIKPLKLTPTDMNFEDILSNLVDVTGGDIVSKLNVDKIVLSRVTHTIYKVIDVLLHHQNDQDSPNPVAISIIFKCMLPKIISASLEGNKNGTNNAVATYVTYSGYLLLNYMEPAFEALFVLLQHLCHQLDGLDRAEVRSARITVVAGLMTFLPKKLHRKLVNWLIKLSDSAKCSHRHIALDLIEKMFSYDSDPNEKHETNETVSKSMDVDMSLQNGESKKQKQNKDNETNNDVEMETDTGIEEELQENIENAVLEHQTQVTVPYLKLLHAVYDRVHDVSAGVRVRALTILANCFQNDKPAMKEALKELQGGGDGGPASAMAVAARGVCDERAVVRRAAAALAHRHIAASPRPSAIDLGILVSLCRDASIIVRSSAIASIAEMLENRPCETLVDAFMLGPIHKLSDPETKIQEQVLSVIRSLMIERIKKYSPDVEDSLPWIILAAITNQNMKAHLQKACMLLSKNSNCISVWLVDALSTHLDAVNEERDLLTLVLLTSVARHVQYSDVDFALQYYYKLADSGDCMDSRLMPLTLDLLGRWNRFMSAEQRTLLRNDLISRLAAAKDDGCRIYRAHLASQLDPSDLTWATELMQMSERSSLSSTDVDEWLRAADLSLVATEPPSSALLHKFLAAMKSPPKEWEGAQLGACVVGLGRLCLRSRAAAAAAAPALAALLHTDAPLHPRRNCLLALFDICTRYSCIVEPHLSAISRCVEQQAPGELRRAAARGLTQQLLAGYLRLRPPLYYTYCALLADDDLDVREPAQYYVSCCLTPDSIMQHFVDTIQHYNSETSENILSFDSRQLIYDIMLQRLSLVQRLNTQCRLAREIFEDAAMHVDDNEELTPAQNNCLLDTITLLCGPRMRLPSKKPQASNSGDIPDIDELQERVTTNVVSQKMKQMVAEMLVPAVLRLHARLRPGGGQLVTYLVRLANDLLEDYSSEIKGLIEEDETMMEQIDQFKETTGLEPIKGNSRNLVTSSAPPEPETPRAPRRRAVSQRRSEGVKKRALQI